jgi:pimeloyl-ACP methyl ester carboxylesterase
MKTLRFLDRTIGVVAPSLVGLYAARIFVRPRESQPRNMTGWTLLTEPHDEQHYVAWGKSAEVSSNANKKVLIIHGWESHAGHMNVLSDALVSAGFDVVAMDAPAHGDAAGEATNAIQFAAALLRVSKELGPFDGLIGHSMGGGAAFIAIADGLNVGKLVTIGSPYLFSDVLHRFARYIGLPPKAERAFVDRIEKLTGRSWDETRGDVVAPKVHQPCLVVHDLDDKEIPFSDAENLLKVLPKGELYQTNGLGHRRILHDRTTAAYIAKWLIS